MARLVKNTMYSVIGLFLIISMTNCDNCNDWYFKVLENERFQLSVGDTFIYQSNMGLLDTFVLSKIDSVYFISPIESSGDPCKSYWQGIEYFYTNLSNNSFHEGNSIWQSYYHKLGVHWNQGRFGLDEKKEVFWIDNYSFNDVFCSYTDIDSISNVSVLIFNYQQGVVYYQYSDDSWWVLVNQIAKK